MEKFQKIDFEKIDFLTSLQVFNEFKSKFSSFNEFAKQVKVRDESIWIRIIQIVQINNITTAKEAWETVFDEPDIIMRNAGSDMLLRPISEWKNKECQVLFDHLEEVVNAPSERFFGNMYHFRQYGY